MHIRKPLLIGVFVAVIAGLSSLAAQEVTESAPMPEATEDLHTFTPEPPSATPTPSETAVLTPTATESPEITAEAAETAAVEATAEMTDEPGAALPTPTLSPDISPSPTLTASLSATPEPSLTLPTATSTATSSIMPTLDFRLMPTATLDIPMVFVQGSAVYQNRQPDDGGIRVYILDGERVLLSIAMTDARGNYTVAAPSEAFYWLVIEAPLHRRYEAGLWPGELLPAVTLPGGDLNGDGCIGQADLDLLVSAFDRVDSPMTDITGDGVTDVADLAILTGNFDSACEILPTPTLTLPPSAMPTVQVTPLPPPTFPVTMPTAITEATEEAAPPEATATPTEAPAPTATDTAVPEEATPDATPG